MRLDAAHSESKNKSVAVRGAKDAARALGGYVSGKPPYGFSLALETRANAEGRPIAIRVLARRDDEAEAIRRLVARVLEATSHVTIVGLAAWLNTQGIPTRGRTVGKNTADSVWSPRTVERILRDPRTAGFAADVVYADRRRPDGRPSASVAGYRIVRNEAGVPVVAHPQIVEPTDWYAVQARLDNRPAPAAPLGAPQPALLSALGILRCECGHPMKAHRNSQRGFRSAYRCTRPAGARRPGQHERDCTVSMGALDDYIARRIFALIATAGTGDDIDTLDTIAEATRLFGLASADPATAAQRGAVAGELDDAERALDTLYDDRTKSGYSGTVGQRRFLTEERRLSDRIDTLTAEIASIDAAASPMLPTEQWLGEPGSDPLGPSSWWHAASLRERRAFVALFVREIVIAKASNSTRPPIESRVASVQWTRPATAN